MKYLTIIIVIILIKIKINIKTDKKISTFKTHIYNNQNHIVIGEHYQLEVYNFDEKKFIKKYIDPDDEKENY